MILIKIANYILQQASVVQQNGSKQALIGEALAFYELLGQHRQLLVVCHLLMDLTCELGAWKGIWSPNLCVLDAQNITDKVAIWQMNTTGAKIWILKKHPGLAMLNPDEVREMGSAGDDYEDESDEQMDE